VRTKFSTRGCTCNWRVSGSRFKHGFKVLLTNATNSGDIFWHQVRGEILARTAKHENAECCPQHGALSGISAGLAFSAITIAISEPFLQPTAENWSPGWRYILAPGSYSNSYRQTTTTIGLEPQHGALSGISTRLHLARIGFKSSSGKDGLTPSNIDMCVWLNDRNSIMFLVTCK
jgi:hypothetical protein